MVRLQKYLAECGIASRRAAEKLVAAGCVTVNGETAVIGQCIDREKDHVLVNGKPVAENDKVYVVLNKPGGTVTTAKDTHGRKTVLDLVYGVKARVFPVGRLDMDVEGVLLMMNDGELAHRLIHPQYHVDKVYLAWVHGKMSPEAARLLEEGIELEDGITAPAKAKILRREAHATLVRLTLREGRKREVKRMCKAAGHPIRSLQRESFGDIRVQGLLPGEWRYLSEDEVSHLRKVAGLSS